MSQHDWGNLMFPDELRFKVHYINDRMWDFLGSSDALEQSTSQEQVIGMVDNDW